MRRSLVLSTLMLLGACNDDPTAAADEPIAAVSDADVTQPGTTPTSASDETKASSGLAGVIGQTLDDAKASGTTLLIPERATVLVGLDIPPFVDSPLFESLKAQLGRRQLEQLEAVTQCGVGPDKWRRFVIGFDPESRNMAMVTEAVGLGTKATLQCLVEQIGTFTLSADGKTMSDHTGGGIVVSDDAIAFATPAWMGPLQDRIDKKGKAAAEGPLRPVLARTDLSKPLWFAGLIPTRQQAMAGGMMGAEPTEFAGALSMSDAIELRLMVTVPDPKTAKTKLQLQWNMLRGLVLSNGVPKAVADSVTFGDDEETVSVELSASTSDIEHMLTTLIPR